MAQRTNWPSPLKWTPVGLALAIFVVDLRTPPGVNESMLYVVPIVLASWTASILPPLPLAGTCTGLIVLGFFFSPAGASPLLSIANRAFAVAMLWTVGVLLRQRQAAEVTLRASEERHRIFAEMTSDFVYAYRVEPDGRLVNEWTGQSVHQVLGYTPEMLRTLPAALDNIHAENRAEIERALSRVLAGESVDFETRVIDARGDVRWLRNWLRPRWNAERTRVDGILGAAQDLTQLKQADQALRESEEKFALLFYEAPFAAVLTQLPEGRIADVNRAFERTLGYSRREVAGRTSVELGLMTDSVRVQLAEAFQAQGAIRDFELTARTRSGEERLILVSSDRIEIGGLPHVLTLIHDITDRKKAEVALRDSEERLRLALDAAHLGAFEWDLVNGRITRSHWHDELWGFRPDEFDGTYAAVARRVDPEDLPRINAEIARCMESHEPFSSEFRIVWPDGSVHWLQGRGELTFDAAGRPAQMRGVVVEVTAQKRADEALREVSKRLMTAEDAERRRIAKELHDSTVQDLVAVMMTLDASRDDVTRGGVDPRQIDDAIAILEKSAHDIRTLSYLLHPPRLEEAGLAGAIREYVAGFRERTGIDVILTTPNELQRPPAHVELALFRVLQEALANMYRHAGSPMVKVTLASAPTGLRLEVEDSGCGIPSEVLANPHHSRPGLGVGIAAMRERLQQIGGRLEIESSPRGTTIRAIVPGDAP